MTKEPLLTFEENKNWQNYHRTSLVGGTVDRFFTPRNIWADGSRDAKAFLPGLRGLQAIVKQAEAGHRRVRAVGSGWSLSNVAFSEEFLVNTSRLNYWFVGFADEAMLTSEFAAKKDRLIFAQCGVQIKTLNGHLESRRLSLMTSGASNGQTITGATSTGTHGSARAVGAMQDFMLGVHVVAEGGKHYFIQRRSRPAVSAKFCEWLDGASLVLDEDAFLAAIVSFGSFGLIHGMLFEAEPIYVLERHVRRYDYAEVVHAAQTLDMTGLGLPRGAEQPFHFEIVINPYKLLQGQKGAFVRVLYKRAAGAELPTQHFSETRLQNSEDLVTIAGFFADVAPSVIPDFLQSQLDDALQLTPPGAPGAALRQSFRRAPRLYLLCTHQLRVRDAGRRRGAHSRRLPPYLAGAGRQPRAPHLPLGTGLAAERGLADRGLRRAARASLARRPSRVLEPCGSIHVSERAALALWPRGLSGQIAEKRKSERRCRSTRSLRANSLISSNPAAKPPM
jgi:hypothetical protein